ncbi:ArsR/SmtB family transcription factor [Cellulomonas sp. P22]|uniref:ArsR/SmtB family transcription factor n=1 Tax=Cellulomonas sp. P22 TaxID=3373189 RepID=UPI003788D02E
MPLPAPGADRPVHEFKAELFKALAHPVRIRTLELLAERDRQVSELLTEIGIEASHLSQHLAVLRRAGVVTAVRQGNAVHYSLAHPAVAAMLAAARTVLLDTLAGARAALADLERDDLERDDAGREEPA